MLLVLVSPISFANDCENSALPTLITTNEVSAYVSSLTEVFSNTVSNIVIKETTGFFDSLSESVDGLTSQSNGV